MTVFVVICRYEGCAEFDNSGAHVLGVFDTRSLADQAAIEHSEKEAHVHYYSSEAEEFEVIK